MQFTAFRPDRVQPGDWYRLLVFVHTSRDFRDVTGTIVRPLVEVENEASRLLGPARDAYGSVRQDGSVALPKGAALTFRPWLDNARFDIDQKIVPWWDPVQRIDFRFMVPRAAAGTHLSGGVDIFRGPLLVADIRFTITVSAEPPKSLWEQDTVAMPAARYRKIFASYSRRDLAVVNSISTVASAFGDTYLLDVNFLRSGERWNDRIYQAISEADIFQLFWSSHSMRSDFVRQEWEHALRLGRPDFIRPVYWEDPLPQDPVGGLPPDALRRIHFARLPVDPDLVGRSAPDPDPTTVLPEPTRSASSGGPEPRRAGAAPSGSSRRDEGPPSGPRRRPGTVGIVASAAFLVFTVGLVGTAAVAQRSTGPDAAAAPPPVGAPALPGGAQPGRQNGVPPGGPPAGGGAGGGAAPPVRKPAPPDGGRGGAPAPGGAGGPAAPPGDETGRPAPVLTVQLVSDSPTKVVVRWTARPSGTYAFTVIVTHPGAAARTIAAGSATQTSIAVEPERPYCVRVTATTPGGARATSKPLALRGASCSG